MALIVCSMLGINLYSALQMERWGRQIFETKIKFKVARERSAELLAEMSASMPLRNSQAHCVILLI